MPVKFTTREWQVVGLIVTGYNFSKQIALIMGISQETLKRHINSVCRKIGCNSKLEICVWYYREYLPAKAAKELQAEDDSD
jgi:DNA-binding CsgD family transcriptional regulator